MEQMKNLLTDLVKKRFLEDNPSISDDDIDSISISSGDEKQLGIIVVLNIGRSSRTEVRFPIPVNNETGKCVSPGSFKITGN